MSDILPQLPLTWFDFAAAPGDPAAPPTQSVRLDGREIPFRLVRQPSDTPRPTLVCLHGMGLTVATFQPIASYLFTSHDLLLIDYNSFSASRHWPAGGVSLRLLAAGVWHVVDALHTRAVSFIGSSLGGGLGLLCGMLAPERTDRLILINPAVYPQDLPHVYRLWRTPVLGEVLMWLTPAQKLIDGVAGLGYSTPAAMPPALRDAYTRNMLPYPVRRQLMDVVRALPAHARESSAHLAMLPAFRRPVLVLWGAQERLLPADTPDRLARDLPRVRVERFADLAHLPHDEAPERLGPLIADFLTTPDSGPL